MLSAKHDVARGKLPPLIIRIRVFADYAIPIVAEMLCLNGSPCVGSFVKKSYVNIGIAFHYVNAVDDADLTITDGV